MVPGENEMSEVEGTEPADVSEQETVDEVTTETEETADSEGEKEWDGDPNKLSPELQKMYKGMQADYTKKSQELKTLVESINSHKDRLSLLDKAEAGDPEARATLARIAGKQEETDKKGYDFESVPESFKTSKDLVSYLDQRFNAAFQNFANQILSQHVAPLQKTAETVRTNEVKAQIEQMRAKYSDFDKNIDSIIEVKQQNPGISLEAAYKVATYQKPTDPKKIVAKPGARPAGVKVQNDKKLSWSEAFELAKTQLGG